MNRSKKIFIAVAVLFLIGVVAVTVDISRKTTFPGSKKHLKESILPSDSDEPDTNEENVVDTLKLKETTEGS